MNKEKQRIAIAEACGTDLYINNVLSDRVPDYLNDLNAMHEAEKTLTWSQKLTFAVNLPGRMSEIVSATAAQRAEAFLKTIGKWEEYYGT